VDTFDVSPTQIKKVFRGQQLVFFGRYADGGQAELEIEARISGQEKVYSTTFQFPDVDTDNPELERLWALNRIQTLEMEKSFGQRDISETETALTELATQYQLVTDYTSMLVLSDSQFEQYGVERRNLARMDVERFSQEQRINNAVTNYRVDAQKPTFGEGSKSSSFGSGGGGGGAGAISPWFASLLAGFLIVLARRTFVS
jgi:Ca-activated chloride channel family protein